jgi:hypothetical protein
MALSRIGAMNKIIGYAILAVFITSIVVNVATYVPSVPITMGMTWPLHLFALAACGAMAFWMNRREKAEQGGQKKPFSWIEFARPFPFALRAACVIAGIYAVINFALFFFLMEYGSPAEENGRYVLQNHGKVIRFLSAEEYQRFRAYEVRGFSGHWMLFSILPAAYFLTCGSRKVADQSESSGSEESTL